jgi:hypothetical protein
MRLRGILKASEHLKSGYEHRVGIIHETGPLECLLVNLQNRRDDRAGKTVVPGRGGLRKSLGLNLDHERLSR